MVHDGEERERFGSLSIAYMSDESSVDETGTIPIHKPEWRSESNCALCIIRVNNNSWPSAISEQNLSFIDTCVSVWSFFRVLYVLNEWLM